MAATVFSIGTFGSPLSTISSVLRSSEVLTNEDEPMKVVQVNVIGLQLLEGIFESDLHVVRVAVGEAGLVRETKFSGEEDFLALARLRKPLPNQLFIIFVSIGRIPELATTRVYGVKELEFFKPKMKEQGD